MTASQPRRRKSKPFNPALAEYQARVTAEEEAKKRDRKTRDKLRNAQLVEAEVVDPVSGDNVLVLRSTRRDPLADMLGRKQITQCEYETGRHWERAYEDSEIGGVAAMDPGKECVDGGQLAEVLTDRQIKAIKELKRARQELGAQGNWLIISILGTKKTVETLAYEWHGARPGDVRYRYVVRRFHECLETLSVLFGYAMATRA